MFSSKRILFLLFITGIESTLFCGIIHFISTPGRQLYEFFFHRSFVQFLILYVFFLTLTLLVHRALHHFRDWLKFKTIKKRKESLNGTPSPFSEHLNQVRKILTEWGHSSALSYIRWMVDEKKEKIEKSFEMIHFLVGALPVLGLFGTVLGLSQSLFIAFSGGPTGPAAIERFVSALGVALDTTILGLVCAMVTGGVAWFLERLENQLIEQQGVFLRKKFSLDAFNQNPAGGPHEGTQKRNFQYEIDTFRAELRSVTVEILTEIRSTFEEMLLGADRSFRQTLDSALKEIIKGQRYHEEAMVERVATYLGERLNKSFNQLSTLIEKHDGRPTKDLISQLKKLEEALRKKNHPSEVIIRYEQIGNHERVTNNA